jgi:hypothetical protein
MHLSMAVHNFFGFCANRGYWRFADMFFFVICKLHEGACLGEACHKIGTTDLEHYN